MARRHRRKTVRLQWRARPRRRRDGLYDPSAGRKMGAALSSSGVLSRRVSSSRSMTARAPRSPAWKVKAFSPSPSKSRGQLCATVYHLVAFLSAAAVLLSDFPETAGVTERRPVDATSYQSRQVAGYGAPRMGRRRPRSNILPTCASVIRSTRGRGLGHPGLVQRVMNRVLVDNAILGPWIHVGSRMQLLNAIGSGDELTARAKVTGNYEKKGHRFVELDALVVANGRDSSGALSTTSPSISRASRPRRRSQPPSSSPATGSRLWRAR